ncbi:MAG: hypothetical protein ACLQNU_02425, partial [Candidatus Dormibacteria bacterium]
GVIAREYLAKFEPWVRHWNIAVSREFLQAYCQSLDKSEILPTDDGQLRTMLLAYLTGLDPRSGSGRLRWKHHRAGA